MASSLPSKAGTSPGAQRRSTIPARNAPRTTSKPNSSATASSASSSSTVQRTVVWAVEPSPSRRICSSRLPRTSRGAKLRTTARTPTAASDPRATNLLLAPRNRAMAKIGNSSPTAPGGQQVAAEAAAEQVVVAQDGQQGAEGGGGQPQGHRDERVHEPGRGQDPDQHGGQGQGDQPAGHGQPPGALPEQVGIQLVAGQQEQEAQADVGQQVDLGPVGPAEGLGADQHA